MLSWEIFSNQIDRENRGWEYRMIWVNVKRNQPQKLVASNTLGRGSSPIST